MVARVDHLLRTQLQQPLGLASPAVRILDPCCGTGAYLTAVLHRIHRTLLENAGDDTALVPSSLRTAALTRVFGFEIMPAPFVISHLQIASLLETAGAPLTDQHRAGVYLTNALTGWVPERHPQSVIFEEFRREREDSEHIKQQGTILVILGNPPYNGYAGIAQIEEERDLTTAYREQIPGLPAPQGQGLNDLYIRFFRIAERRIVGDANVHGNDGGCGIVCLISNNNWLDGLSHVSMRKKYIDTFQSIYIDNLNGDKYRTGKTTPEGKPDPSAFSTPQNREGIQVGTAIATLVRTSAMPIPKRPVALKGHGFSRAASAPNMDAALAAEGMMIAEELDPEGDGGFNPRIKPTEPTRALAPEGISSPAAPMPQINLRDLWGTNKLAQLARESRREAEPAYSPLTPAPALGSPFAHRAHSAAYTSWPRLPELFPISFPGIKTSRDTLLVDIDRNCLDNRMRRYLEKTTSDMEIADLVPAAMLDSARFDATSTRRTLQEKGFRPWQILRYAYRPFDLRWLYWEPDTKLLDEKRSDYIRQTLFPSACLAAQQKSRGESSPPQLISQPGCLDLLDRGASCIPAVIIESATLHSTVSIRTNLTQSAESYLESLAAPKLDPFHHALATMHTPAYRTENAGALLGDWPRIPLPATAEQLTHSASLGRRLAELLDAESSINLATEWSFLAALKLPRDPNLEEALKLTAGWGHKGQGSTVMPGRGLASERPWTEAEIEKLSALAAACFPTNSPCPIHSRSSRMGGRPQKPGSQPPVTLEAALALLGETCVDVYLNGNAHWAAVPVNVWNYTLGGYQVLKKWLSYREFTAEPASPLLHRALHADEAAYFAQVVRRIAAILLLGPALDMSYRSILPTTTGLPSAD